MSYTNIWNVPKRTNCTFEGLVFPCLEGQENTYFSYDSIQCESENEKSYINGINLVVFDTQVKEFPTKDGKSFTRYQLICDQITDEFQVLRRFYLTIKTSKTCPVTPLAILEVIQKEMKKGFVLITIKEREKTPFELAMEKVGINQLSAGTGKETKVSEVGKDDDDLPF